MVFRWFEWSLMRLWEPPRIPSPRRKGSDATKRMNFGSEPQPCQPRRLDAGACANQSVDSQPNRQLNGILPRAPAGAADLKERISDSFRSCLPAFSGSGSAPLLPQCLRRTSLLTQRAQAQGIVAFGEANAGVVRHQGAMKKRRRWGLKRAIEQELARGGFEQIRAAHHFRDVHRSIVHDHGKLIGGNVIVPPDHEVAKIFPGDKLLRAEVAIVEGYGFAGR